MTMIISVEGNIGSGKSTLLTRLQDTLNQLNLPLIVLPEPVDDWMQPIPGAPGDQSLFSLYYHDKVKYGFMFQMLALHSRVEKLLHVRKQHPNAIIICERSHLTDKEVFAKMLADSHVIGAAEYHVYLRWFQTCCSLLDSCIGGMVYIRASPSTCVSRIIKRSRGGEEAITLDYIARLHEYHEDWLMSGTPQYPCCVINGEVGEDDPKSVHVLLDFLQQLLLQRRNMTSSSTF